MSAEFGSTSTSDSAVERSGESTFERLAAERWTQLAQAAGIVPGEPLVVALSGGGDSVLLLELARRAEPAHPLLAVHVDHGLRGEESRGDADFCRALCATLEVPLCVREVELDPRPQGLEARARDARYRVLVEEARAAGAATILTAHHADDALETLLLRWTRGTRLGGLAGLARRRSVRLAPGISIVRPLLPLRRAEVRAWLAESGLAHREDGSNEDLRFARNRLRRAVLPTVERVAGPTGVENLLAFARAVQDLERTLEDSTAHLAWKPLPHAAARAGTRRMPSREPGPPGPLGASRGEAEPTHALSAGGVLARGALMTLPPALRKRALARLLLAGTARAPGRALVERISEQLAHGRLGRHSLGGGFYLRLGAAELVLEPPRGGAADGPSARARPGREKARTGDAVGERSCREPVAFQRASTPELPFAPPSPSEPGARRGGSAVESEESFERPLPIPGLLALPDGRRLSAHVLLKNPTRDVPRNECAVELDLDQILALASGRPAAPTIPAVPVCPPAAARGVRPVRHASPPEAGGATSPSAELDGAAVLGPHPASTLDLRVRFGRRGDRFHALGAPGSKALSRFLAERGIPRGDRSRVPLVVAGSTILWVAGVRPCDAARVTPATRRRLRLELDLG